MEGIVQDRGLWASIQTGANREISQQYNLGKTMEETFLAAAKNTTGTSSSKLAAGRNFSFIVLSKSLQSYCIIHSKESEKVNSLAV